MMAAEVVERLKEVGSDSVKRILMRHGAREPVLGVKVEELKKIQRGVRKDHALALQLFETGIYDAQYLAGLIADERQATPEQLRGWLAKSNSGGIRSTAVAWLAAESAHGERLAREWIDSADAATAQTGWNTLAGLVGVREDAALDFSELEGLLARVETTVHQQPDTVRYAMNGFLLSAGIHVTALTERAIAAAERMGRVSVDMGETACQVPYGPDYIRKAQARGAIGKKRKSARC